jgi:hypothetical protein
MALPVAGRACCPASGNHVDESIKLIAAATGGGASSARARRLSPAVLAGQPELGLRPARAKNNLNMK